ncbi:PAS domain S-box protein [Nocardioides sp. KIGAM211]|uniref:histidine kinase n=1 Tax=Nocardioides luti TaxID=2761101 RepID=A0A7X0RLF4_9ACTN|nr:ATP-binding protein [Nocardioides luti]MBB6629375.1 PAS domain S-box protein [Nocardioides luti]
MTTPGVRPPRWGTALGMLLAIYLAGVGAVLFAPEGDPVATFWPAAGLAVALLALSPRSWWPPLALGVVAFSGAANVTGGRDLDVSLLFGIANAAEAVVAAWILQRGTTGRPRLDTQDDFLRLVEAALLGGLTIAAGATLTVLVVGDGSAVETWRAVFPSHGASTLVLVPVAMTLHHAHPPTKRLELVLQAVALTVVTLLIFSPQQSLSLTFMALPFLVWAALRFDIRVVAWELAGFAALTTFLTARGFGPFGDSLATGRIDASGAGALTQGYLLCAALMSLPLAIAVEQRRNLLARVSSSELLFRRNFTESLAGMLLMRRDGDRLDIFDLNDTATQLLGGDGEPLVGRSLDDILDTSEQLDVVAGRMLDGTLEGWKAQTGLVGRPGARINVALSLLSREPDPVFAAQLQDVTAEHQARTQLEAAEKLTSATLDTTACLILVTDLDGTIVRVNAATTQLTGFTEAELLGRPVWETAIAPAYATELASLLDGPRRDDATAVREADASTKWGDKLRIVWNDNVVRDQQDRPVHVVLTGIDVTAERATAGLMSHLLQAAITTALIGIDTRGRITVFNSGAQHLLGYHPDDMIGTPFTQLLEPEQLLARTGARSADTAFAALTGGVGPDGETTPRDWTWVASGGRHHTVAMTLSVAADSFAAQVGFLCVGRDVTEQRHSQEMLVAALDKERTAVERLRQLDEAKNEFVSTVSHELRTPVTSIVGYTEMLADGSIVDPDPDQLPLLRTIARNGERLIVICNDLLLLSGLDSGAQHWERETLDLVTILDPAEEAVRPLLTARDLAFEIERPDGPVVVMGDRAQLERVLINLLSNAVKFTDDGGTVRCRIEHHTDEAWLVVADDGIGIPEEEQSGLFQKFFRSSTAQERAIQGTGLGLSIVAAIIAAHGGRIGVESAHLKGTTFTVRLPLKRPGSR